MSLRFVKLLLLTLFVAHFAMFTRAADAEAVAKRMLTGVEPGTIAFKGADGWLYSKNELAHLAKGALVEGKIAGKSNCSKPQNADPIPAIVDFNDQLKALGIELLVVPVPPKMAVYPAAPLAAGDAMASLKPFYEELRGRGVKVLDLSDLFIANAAAGAPLYCKTDAHWSPSGMLLAAEEITGRKKELKPAGITVSGDLARSLNPEAPAAETVDFFEVPGENVSEKSPYLLIGDSHTLVFHSGGDMLAGNGGLVDLLAALWGEPVDLIGVKGSAATAVRVNLYRKASGNPEWLKNKKLIIWCFTAREFTESTTGWVRVPVLKK
ncbi:MAG: hypothetical protein AB7F40_10640 [Victivallaceae bacterium]|nr:hypothetical protein [Victivallaceae bacterium]